jgi:hypothetical protein
LCMQVVNSALGEAPGAGPGSPVSSLLHSHALVRNGLDV